METLDKRQKWSQEQTISGKASVVSVNGTAGGGGGGLSFSAGDLRGRAFWEKF